MIDIQNEKERIIKEYGAWTAHNIKLAEDIYTITEKPSEKGTTECILQAISDNTKKPISKLRILDLGCLEGLYAIELGLHGAEVVGIEGRKANIVKARFAQECLALNNVTFIQDDVLNLSTEKYGYFDVVLCCGILYHINTPEIFKFVEEISEVCTGFAIIDTHFGEAEKIFLYKGKQYWGSYYREFNEGTTEEEKENLSWASLHNNESFWFTPYSLFNLLQNYKFTSVYQIFIPMPSQQENRFTLIAHKGNEVEIKSRENKKEILEYPF